MTRKSRTILFYSFVLLFLLLCPVLVLYSQGYRFDAANRKIAQTGGIFIKIEPKQADVYINGKLEKKTDFFFGSALIKNLLPKKYKIEVKKEGYQTWEKNLQVKEKEVAEAKSVVLFPKNPDFNLLENNIENLWFSPETGGIIIKEIDFSASSTWSLKAYDPYKNVKSFLIDGKSIYSKGADLIRLDFSQNPQEIYLDVGIKEQIKSFVLNYNENPPLLKEKATTTIPDNTVVYKKTIDIFYYLDNDGYLFKSDLSLANKQKINTVPLPIKQETDYEIFIMPGQIFIKEDFLLYRFDSGSGSFEKFFEQFKGLKASPDSRTFLLFSESEIWVLYGQPTGGQAPEKTFLMRFSEKIDDIFWLDNNHLAFNAGDNIKISETDNRDGLNIYDIGQFKKPAIYFNQTDKKLYIFSEKHLYSSKPLLQ
jgi:hypothetical protein